MTRSASVSPRPTGAARALALLLALAPAYAAAAPLGGAERAVAMEEAKGRFDIQTKPASAPGAAVARMTFDKRLTGELEGDSTGEMLSYGSPASGNAGYVVIERVTGALKGRSGAFALQHSGVLEGGKPSATIRVVPGSGTGDLAGIAGAMTIDPTAGHTYVLRYTLPGGGRAASTLRSASA